MKANPYRYAIKVGNQVVARLDATREDVVWLARELAYRRSNEWVSVRDREAPLGEHVCLIEPTAVVSSSDADQPELC